MIPFFIGSLLYYAKSAQAGEPNSLYRWAAIVFFTIACVSDALDGYVARHWNQRSHLGAILDPLADKALLLGAIITLSLIDIPGAVLLPIWFLVLVLARDILLISGVGFLHLYVKEVQISPHWSGKLTTFLQMAAVCLVLLPWLPEVTEVMIILAGASTALSALVYLMRGLKVLSEHESNPS